MTKDELIEHYSNQIEALMDDDVERFVSLFENSFTRNKIREEVPFVGLYNAAWNGTGFEGNSLFAYLPNINYTYCASQIETRNLFREINPDKFEILMKNSKISLTNPKISEKPDREKLVEFARRQLVARDYLSPDEDLVL